MAHIHPTVAMPSRINHPNGHMATRVRDLVVGVGSGGFEVLTESETPLVASCSQLPTCRDWMTVRIAEWLLA
jgi:hypothetical protein